MASSSLRPYTLILAFVALTSVTAQTFQYSRGWTNGKRDGHKRSEDIQELASKLNPCQIKKLKYILSGKVFTDRVLPSCDYMEEDTEIQPRIYSKNDRNQDNILEAFL